MYDVDYKVDARGEIAPLPMIGFKRVFDAAAAGEVVELISDDPETAGDVEKYIKVSGHELLGSREEEGVHSFWIRRVVYDSGVDGGVDSPQG